MLMEKLGGSPKLIEELVARENEQWPSTPPIFPEDRPAKVTGKTEKTIVCAKDMTEADIYDAMDSAIKALASFTGYAPSVSDLRVAREAIYKVRKMRDDFSKIVGGPIATPTVPRNNPAVGAGGYLWHPRCTWVSNTNGGQCILIVNHPGNHGT